MIWTRKNYNRLNQMLDEGIRGEFKESRYDETELSRLEVKWKRFLENAEHSRMNLENEKENIKSLISNISHQTKTPVANMRLYGELLEESLLKDGKPQQLDMARQICVQAEKLEFLIQSLTKISRLESNILKIEPASHPISSLVKAAVSQIRPQAEKHGIQIREDCREDFLSLYDPKWTEEALYNLLDNGVKYSPAGSVISITTKKYEIYGSVSVRDQGMGISKEEVPLLFSRFYRSPQVQQQEGVGIGLYLAREIVRKQKGYIKAAPNKDTGSTFSIFLPVTDKETESSKRAAGTKEDTFFQKC